MSKFMSYFVALHFLSSMIIVSYILHNNTHYKEMYMADKKWSKAKNDMLIWLLFSRHIYTIYSTQLKGI